MTSNIYGYSNCILVGYGYNFITECVWFNGSSVNYWRSNSSVIDGKNSIINII